MKKLLITILIILIALITTYLSFGYRKDSNPNTFYKVYLNNEVLGVIKSKKELENYIDKQNIKYKKQYNTDKIYAPNGLKIIKVSTYNETISNVRTVYNKIDEKGPDGIS